MNYPTYIEINGTKYNINTDFRVAIRCNEIAEDKTINDYERAMAIIYVLFGEKALDDYKNHEILLNYAKKFLSCNQEIENKSKQPDMDFIEGNFLSEYNYSNVKKVGDYTFYNN